jgi:hypothetical protein
MTLRTSRPRRLSFVAILTALVLAAALAGPVAAGQVRLRVAVTPNPMNFGSVVVGEASAPQVLYVTNRSVIPIKWTGTVWQYGANSGGSWHVFDLAAGMTASCFDLPDVTIQPGQTCAIDVISFAPERAGPYSLTTGIRFSDGVGYVDVWIPVKGKGI